jgi:hypothetical protein
MHAAVKARIYNPALPPLAALKKGGFVFFTARDGTIYDNDKVTLSQRKNQLSRRIRLQKKQTTADNFNCNDEVNAGYHDNSEGIEDFCGTSSIAYPKKKGDQIQEFNNTSIVTGLMNDIDMIPLSSEPNGVNAANESSLPQISGPNSPPNLNDYNANVEAQIMDVSSFDSNTSQRLKRSRISSFSVPAALTQLQDPRYTIALDNFKSDVASLLKRSMMSAGFNASETDECDEAYICFAQKALDDERERIERIGKKINYNPEPEPYNPEPMERNHDKNQEHTHMPSVAHTHSQAAAHSHPHSHPHSHSHSHPQSHSHPIKKDCLHSRHLHRLEGMCGHKAIVHKPPGGNPHIDFVVNNMVECFAGCNPLMDTEAFWPSTFSEEETVNEMTHTDHRDCNGNMPKENQRQHTHLQKQSQQNLFLQQQQRNCEVDSCKPPKKDPQIFSLKDLDFDNGEWSPIQHDHENAEDDERLLANLFSLKQQNGG